MFLQRPRSFARMTSDCCYPVSVNADGAIKILAIISSLVDLIMIDYRNKRYFLLFVFLIIVPTMDQSFLETLTCAEVKTKLLNNVR